MYFPTHTYIPLADSGANRSFSELAVTTRDGISLKAWYAPATSKACTIVFFHGNGDSLATAAQIADPYINAGYGFLLTEYRGYSGLPGSPTEMGLYSDARADLQSLVTRGVDPSRILLYGHSLGTGVAVQMATEERVGGIMLLAPYLSIPKVGQVHYPFLPVEWLAKDRFDNQGKVSAICVPLLIARGTEDQIVPPSQGDALFALASEPKEFHSIQGRGHNDSFDKFVPISLHWLAQVCH